MKDIKFRDLRKDEVECRVGSTGATGFSLLLYKTARTDANILDETVGAFNWQKKFYQVKNTMICSLGINMNYNDESKEPYWVWKDDAGDESNTEAIKGEASDAFKRAGFAFGGIGRKLYNSPFIWINNSNENTKTSRYEVTHIAFDEDSVSELVIINSKTKQEVFSYGLRAKSGYNKPKSENNGNVKLNDISNQVNSMEEDEDLQVIRDYYNSQPQDKKERFSAWLFQVVQETDIEKLSVEKAHRVATTLRKAQSK